MTQSIPKGNMVGVNLLRLERVGSFEVPKLVASLGFSGAEEQAVQPQGLIIIPTDEETRIFGGVLSQRMRLPTLM